MRAPPHSCHTLHSEQPSSGCRSDRSDRRYGHSLSCHTLVIAVFSVEGLSNLTKSVKFESMRRLIVLFYFLVGFLDWGMTLRSSACLWTPRLASALEGLLCALRSARRRSQAVNG